MKDKGHSAIHFRPVTLYEKWLMNGDEPVGLFQINVILKEDDSDILESDRPVSRYLS